MLNYFAIYCQSKKRVILLLFTLFFLAGCAHKRQEVGHKKFYDKVKGIPVWFNVDKRFAFRDNLEKIIVHPFFDLSNFASLMDNSVNFVALTPEDTEISFDIDLVSGRFFKREKFCPQKDVWESYRGTMNRPPYTEGFIPRLLDQLGTPQRIIVFGSKNKYKDINQNMSSSYRVRIVGGVVEQTCKKYPCLTFNSWLSRLVLIAVDPDSVRYANVYTFDELKRMVNWEYIKAFMQNVRGRNSKKNSEFPYVRVFGGMNERVAFETAFTKGHRFQYKEIKALRNSCFELYDYTWKAIQDIRKNTKQVNDLEYVKSKILNLTKDKKVSNHDISIYWQKLLLLDKKKFLSFFQDFHKRFKDRYFTCSKYVRAANINQDIERNWFFSYLTAFFNAEKLGFVYVCSKREWFQNFRKNDNSFHYSQDQQLKMCTPASFENSFERAVEVNRRLFNSQNREFYRYIEYDFYTGSNKKLYSWVKFTGKRFNCLARNHSIYSIINEEKTKEKMFLNDDDVIFPNDVRWNRIYNQKSRELKYVE